MKKIIIVDDEINSLKEFISNIVDNTYSITFFNDNPLSSLEYIKNEEIDLVFLDINMPKINGEELAEKMIEMNKNIKIAFISGFIFNEEELKNKFKDNLIGLIRKPYTKDDLIEVLTRINKVNYFIYTFGNFDLLIDDKPIIFLSSKSKELLALLVHKNGKSLTMDEAICYLWPDLDLDKSKILYRDAVWKLRKILNQYSLNKLVTFNRALLFINKIIPCDYWNLLDNKKTSFNGQYLINYDWSIETQNYLCNLVNV